MHSVTFDHLLSPGFRRRENNNGQSAHNGKVPVVRIEIEIASNNKAFTAEGISPAKIRAEKNK